MMVRLISITICLWILVSCSGSVPGNIVLFDFETEAELEQLRWKCYTLFSLSKEHVTHGTRSLQMELYPSAYPGFNPRLARKDWRKFKAVCFDIYNPEIEETEIIIRVDDQGKLPAYADRYNQSFVLKAGPNRICISLDSLITSGTQRHLNLKKIYRSIIFMDQPQKKYVLFIDYIHLISS